MRDPLFCKKTVPAPSAKNSYMAGETTNVDVGALLAAPHYWQAKPCLYIGRRNPRRLCTARRAVALLFPLF